MNILQIVSSSRTSGAEKHVLVLSDRLRRHGHKVMAVCPSDGWLPAQLRDAGIPALEVAMRGPRSWASTFMLARLVRKHRIDLIHTHLTRATYLGALVGRLTRLPVVSSCHVQTHDPAYRFLFHKQRNRIITVSDFVRNGLLAHGIRESQIQTIYNGTEFCLPGRAAGEDAVDGSLPVHAELSLPPDAELVGLFARVDEFKGHPILVRAVRHVVAARPRAYFLCVGAVEARMQRMLWETAAADDVAERLRFTGVRNDVQRLMSAVDVVTLPSRYEACSMSIIEAMALGKPVVATRAGGNPELVEDCATGLLIERTPEALAEALICVLSDPERRRRMGEAGRRRAEACFTDQVMVGKIEAVYRELVECAGAA
ncbi:MAG TPA: glycosyltransferase [Chthonomonadaceae bacterium]|nr:glycosyltransferase [Chthonomonadaceae bacterium]